MADDRRRAEGVRVEKPQTSTRDRDAVVQRFAAWLGAELGPGAGLRVTDLGRSSSGFSSDTFLLDLAWVDDGGPQRREAVLRLPPPRDSFPIFPAYDLGRQVAAMRLVGDHTAVPVPDVLWAEDDPDALGVPFFVMGRRAGLVPPDVMPYTWGSWVTELDEPALRHMSDRAIDVLAGVHSIEVTDAVHRALSDRDPTASAVAAHLASLRSFYEWGAAGSAYPTVDRCFAAVEATAPEIEGPDRVCWGDARVGNIMWVGGEPTAVLDWEMVTVGPPELDVAWMLWFADFFQRSAERQGRPGVPAFLEPRSAVARYEALTGHRLRHLEWFLTLTALHEVLISIRTSTRAVAFGELAAPDDPEAILHPLPDLIERVAALDDH